MKIPNEIQIAGIKYKVRYDPELHKRELNHAMIIYNKCEIIIDSNVEKQIGEHAFIHEVLHGALSVVSQSMNKESFVAPLSELLYQAVKQIVDFNKK